MENNKVKIATGSITEELRKMEVGETIQFPLEDYPYNSVRNSPTTSLAKERLVDGKKWKTMLDSDSKSTLVTRIA